VTAVFPGENNGLRVVMVEVSLAELTGPVQYIQPLELNSESTAKLTAVLFQVSVPSLIHLIKAVRVVTSFGGRRVNLPFRFVSSRLILEEESKGIKMLSTD
jgi:hypothetical protein